jgi:ABC-type oligopeptide transport system substrate-binding subunit
MTMKRVLLLAAAALVALPLAARAEVWKNASLLDSMCSAKEKVAKDPDSHPSACALSCAKSGYGIVDSSGKFLKFDKAGNDLVLAALKSTKKTDHLRVTVDGDLRGDTIAVKSVTLD